MRRRFSIQAYAIKSLNDFNLKRSIIDPMFRLRAYRSERFYYSRVIDSCTKYCSHAVAQTRNLFVAKGKI